MPDDATARLDCPLCEASATTLFMAVEGRRYWRCAHCMATFLDPVQHPDREAERAEYALHQNDVDDAHYRRFLDRLVQPLRESLPAASSGLDYGCGPAPALAAMMREAGHDMAVFDPAFFNDPVVLLRQYDFITCTEVVEHFHHPAAEFRKLDRLLRPGGCLAIMTHFQTDDARFANWHYRRDPTHVIFYRRETFLQLARIHGWRCVFPADNVVFLRKGAVGGVLEAGGDFADGVIAFEGHWLGGEAFVSFDQQAVALLAAQGHATRLPWESPILAQQRHARRSQASIASQGV